MIKQRVKRGCRINTAGGKLIAIAVAATVTLHVPVCVTIIVLIVALRLPLLDGTTTHDGHLSSQTVLFRFRNLIFSALCVLARCRNIFNLQL